MIAGPLPFVRHVHDVDAREVAKELAREVRRVSGPGRSVIELPRLRFGERDQLLDRLRLHARMHDDDVCAGREQAHRRKVAREIVRRLRLQARVDHVRGARHEKRIAVGRRVRGDFRAEVAARAGAVVDHELLPEAFGHLLDDDARHDVDGAARRGRDEDAHGSRRIRLRPCRRRRGEKVKKTAAPPERRILFRLSEVGHHRREKTPGFAARDAAMIESERKRQDAVHGRRAVRRDDRVADAARADDRDRRRHDHG